MKVQIIFYSGRERRRGKKKMKMGEQERKGGRGELLNYESVRNSKEEKEMKWKRRK